MTPKWPQLDNILTFQAACPSTVSSCGRRNDALRVHARSHWLTQFLYKLPPTPQSGGLPVGACHTPRPSNGNGKDRAGAHEGAPRALPSAPPTHTPRPPNGNGKEGVGAHAKPPWSLPSAPPTHTPRPPNGNGKDGVGAHATPPSQSRLHALASPLASRRKALTCKKEASGD